MVDLLGIGTKECCLPGDRRVPIMADDRSLALAERRDQSDQSANGVEDTVGGNVRGRAALPETMSGATT